MLPFLKKILNKPDDATLLPGAVFVDVRSKNEFASGHLPGAWNIPLEQVESQAANLKGHPQVVVYCRSGNRSAHAKKILISSGLTHVVDGGSLSDAKSLAEKAGIKIDDLVKETIPAVSREVASLKDENVLKVLIPTDFSVQADFSYLLVRNLEEHLSVDIHFLHVLDFPDTVTLDGNGNIETCGEIDIDYVNGQKRIADAKLNQLKVLYGESVSVHLQFGKVTDTIIQFAESNQYDLIVMGTKGVWGVKEKIASTEAQMVARRSNIPLLSLMCDRSDLVIKDILFVHDFMENDHTEIPLMQTFSKYFDAAYHMLYIHNDLAVDPQKVHENIRKHAEAHNLTTWYGHIVVAPDVETGVNEFLKTQDADMVFVGTHGKGGFFHKSAAESLIKHLFKPIITFHFNTK